jgi:hypothetical protein
MIEPFVALVDYVIEVDDLLHIVIRACRVDLRISQREFAIDGAVESKWRVIPAGRGAVAVTDFLRQHPRPTFAATTSISRRSRPFHLESLFFFFSEYLTSQRAWNKY